VRALLIVTIGLGLALIGAAVWLVSASAVTTATQLAHASACPGTPPAADICYVDTPGSIMYVSVQSNNSGGKDVDVHLKLADREFDDYPAYSEQIVPLHAGEPVVGHVFQGQLLSWRTTDTDVFLLVFDPANAGAGAPVGLGIVLFGILFAGLPAYGLLWRQANPLLHPRSTDPGLDGRLMMTFHFNRADLARNRAGRLSGHQVLRLVLRELRLWVLIVICTGVAVPLGWLLTTGPGLRARAKAIIFLPIAVGVGVYFLVKASRMLIDLLRGSVESRSGMLELYTRESSWDWLWPWDDPKWMVAKYRMDADLEFGVPKWAVGKLPERLSATAYFTPGVKRLVALEPSLPTDHGRTH
jgi:hypothetical protein